MCLFTQNLLPHLLISSDFRGGGGGSNEKLGVADKLCEDGADHTCGSEDGQVRSARSHHGLIFTYEIVSYM